VARAAVLVVGAARVEGSVGALAAASRESARAAFRASDLALVLASVLGPGAGAAFEKVALAARSAREWARVSEQVLARESESAWAALRALVPGSVLAWALAWARARAVVVAALAAAVEVPAWVPVPEDWELAAEALALALAWVPALVPARVLVAEAKVSEAVVVVEVAARALAPAWARVSVPA
jgi:hypothetical protein